MKKLAILACFLAVPQLTHAAEVDPDATAADIFQDCENAALTRFKSDDYHVVYSSGYCRGFIMGLWDAGAFHVCGPEAVRPYDLILIFNAFVKKEPVWRTRDPSAAIIASMRDAFPCPAK